MNGDWDPGIAAAIVDEHAASPGALLPMLHALQDEFGYISDEVIPTIAQALNRTSAEVHGVVSFYHDFKRAPQGRHRLKLCRAEACQATGGDALAASLMARLGLGWGETTPDGVLTVDPVYCLGLCACAPAALLDGEPIGRMTTNSLERALDRIGHDSVRKAVPAFPRHALADTAR